MISPCKLFFFIVVTIALLARPGLTVAQSLKEVRIGSSKPVDPDMVVDFSFAKELGF